MPTQTAEYVDAIDHLPAGSTLVIADVSWESYERLLEDLGEGYAPRVWYDEGRLEVVTPSGKHERAKDFILALARVIAEERGIRLETLGSTTFKQKTFRRGAEPDTCFYVQHAAQIIGKDDIDLASDPPPDVIVEVDIHHSSLRKMSFYAQLGVPEAWRYDGWRAIMFRLSADGYEEMPSSLAFPALTADTLSSLLDQLAAEGQHAVLTRFRTSFHGRNPGL